MKTQKGITLIALIITIIVMLILVGVSVSVALNTGLFKTAQGAAKNTQLAAEGETALSNGTINIKGQEGEIDIDDYVASLKGEGAKWELTDDKDENGEISVGDLVTYKEKPTEQFYVISVTGDTVAMLAAKNITTTGELVQSDSAPMIAFCSATAWNGASVAADDNLNDKQTIKSEATSAVALAKAYGQSLGVETGRLMIISEVEVLETANSTILYGQYEEGSYLNYWIGSAVFNNTVWNICGEYICWGNSQFDADDSYGVRPVVEILKSDI